MPRVLIVDDNPTNLQIVGNLLSAEVFDIGVALNAEQALEFVDEHPLDLVLLDIVMPGMDGYEVCRRIRKKYGPATLPIIFLTSRSDEESVVRGFEAGGVDYVIKPFRCHELLARVNTHIELKRARDAIRLQLEEIHTMRGILPICSHCRRIREDDGYWEEVHTYFQRHADIRFSHGICPECARIHYPDLFGR